MKVLPERTLETHDMLQRKSWDFMTVVTKIKEPTKNKMDCIIGAGLHVQILEELSKHWSSYMIKMNTKIDIYE